MSEPLSPLAMLDALEAELAAAQRTIAEQADELAAWRRTGRGCPDCERPRVDACRCADAEDPVDHVLALPANVVDMTVYLRRRRSG